MMSVPTLLPSAATTVPARPPQVSPEPDTSYSLFVAAVVATGALVSAGGMTVLSHRDNITSVLLVQRPKLQPAMSALPLKADIRRCTRNVRFGPIADIRLKPTVVKFGDS